MSARSKGTAAVGVGILGVLLACALAASLIAPFDPDDRAGVPFARPSGQHLLGTDDAGHDLLSMLIYGAQVSLLVGIVAALAATAVAAVVGTVAGYAQGWVDSVLMRLVDVMLSLPVLPLTIVVGVSLGPSLRNQILVIAAVSWAGIARELRSQVLTLRERDYVQALRAMGASPHYVLRRHIGRAVVPLLIPQFVLAIKTSILLEASLAFLGLGDPSARSWGSTLSAAHARGAFLTDAWVWWVLPPGLAIAVTVLGFALLGNYLEDRSRPSLRRTRALGRAERRGTAQADDDMPLAIDGLSVRYGTASPVVRDLSLTVRAGEIVGLVGESGCGKSTVAASSVGLLPPSAEVTEGTVRVCGHDVTGMPADALRALRGDRIALIPQEAMSALDPVQRIGAQLVETVLAHQSSTRAWARARAAELLTEVGIDPDCVDAYPHQLSGGMRQRVVIAMALANKPAVIVADEPTSGLDVLVESDVRDLLLRLRDEVGVALLIVSHDLAVIEEVADRIAVMLDGRIVEDAPAGDVVDSPSHPYTRRLLQSVVRLQPATIEAG